MNYYLIWTDEGWLKLPTYNHVICSGCGNLHLNGIDSTINTTQNIRHAYRLTKEQAEECLEHLHRYGVASWAIEVRDDILDGLLQKINAKRKEKTNG